MASTLLALIDDIATILDDVAILSKVAAKKTAGVLGDDLALNAQQVAGVSADRELPVVWAVCKGSLVNKLILVPAALGISIVAPWLVTPLLMVGGAYLCFEGFEKLAHKFLHSAAEDAAHNAELMHALEDSTVDLMALERDKIKGAIRTDFVLSAEIIAITLGTVQTQPWTTQLTVLCSIALLMTFGVYGFVAGIVKIDDLGLHLMGKTKGLALGLQQAIGRGLLKAAPWLMKALAIVGTAAMFWSAEASWYTAWGRCTMRWRRWWRIWRALVVRWRWCPGWCRLWPMPWWVSSRVAWFWPAGCW
jgi:uncharacterized protein